MDDVKSKPGLIYAIQYFDETGKMRAPYLICKGFLANGWNVEIFTTASPRNVSIDRVWDEVQVQKVDGPTKKIRIINLAAKFLKRRKGKVVLTFVWDWHCFALALSKLFFGSPYVIAMDTYAHQSANNFLGRVREEIRYGFALRNASIILAEAPFTYEHAEQHLKRPEILLVPFCLWQKDLKEIESSWESEGIQLKRSPVILYAGRLVERKNVHDLINAFSCLANRFPEWQLEIRGILTSADYYDTLQRLVQANKLDNRIHFLPSLAGEALYKRYRKTSIFALPSQGEGLPTAITETMYFGGAIVAGISGAVSYQLDNGTCGMLHQPGDVNLLTSHLNILMGSWEERQHYMRMARERMIEHFTWERHFPVIEEKLRRLIE